MLVESKQCILHASSGDSIAPLSKIYIFFFKKKQASVCPTLELGSKVVCPREALKKKKKKISHASKHVKKEKIYVYIDIYKEKVGAVTYIFVKIQDAIIF